MKMGTLTLIKGLLEQWGKLKGQVDLYQAEL
jgi:hypothetical protein